MEELEILKRLVANCKLAINIQDHDEAHQYLDEIQRKLIACNKKVQKLKANEEKLEKLVTIDKLTGLRNSHGLELVTNRLNARIERAKHDKEKFPVCLAYMDLNNFKPINDTYGHHVGDKMIAHFAKTVNSFIRDTDYLIRLHGDEFLCIMPNTNFDDAHKTMEKLVDKLTRSSFVYKEKELEVSTSIGLVEKYDHETFEECIQLADKLMYKAKKSTYSYICCN